MSEPVSLSMLKIPVRSRSGSGKRDAVPQDSPNARERLARGLAALRAASGLKQEAAAAGATSRLNTTAPPGKPVRKITGQRISDWETGKNLPASERELGALVRVLIEHVRRRSRDADLPAELLDEMNWPHWWRKAQDLPKPAGDAAASAWEGGPPYLGMKPFGEGDSEVFFGREQTCGELVAMLSERVSKPDLLIVFGPSGAGKSSLLRAGLLDHLAREGLPGIPEAARWPRRVMSPTEDPLGQLAVHLAALTGGDALAIREGLRSRPGDAHLLFQQASMTESEQGRVVLVVDQFEEIFTLASKARDDASAHAFVTALHAAATTPTGPSRAPAALVVVGVRGDFLDRCGGYPPLQESQRAGVFPLAPMTDSELLRAITGPAGRAGLSVERGLADLVLAELRASGSEPAAGVGVLPLLSQAMLATWHQCDGRSLTIAGYGAAGGVATAVQTSAARAYSLLSGNQQALMRHITQRLTVMTVDGHWARRRIGRTELLAGYSGEDLTDAEAVLDHFVEQRLMVADSEGTIELAHDLLLTTWPTLAGWLEEDREGRIVLDQIQERAAIWRRDTGDT
ncbi:ATP-binding protein [Nonomuraea sp. NPDC001636]|uniref:ATP-binding protein n=1 Tax=Nonomuraea sp. NPDC001636 TaxID=3154391 RepID=UPI0033270EE5